MLSRELASALILTVGFLLPGHLRADAGADDLRPAPPGSPRVSFAQAITPRPSPEPDEGLLPLKSSHRFGTRLLVTLHDGSDKEGNTASRLNVYWQDDQGNFEPLFEIQAGSNGDSFENPVGFQFDVPGSGPQAFLFLQRRYAGTGHYHDDWIFRLNEQERLEPVEFLRAPVVYRELAPDEGIWKGEWNNFSASPPEFDFGIWKEGDANCCPSGGRVSGTYRAEKIDEAGQPARYRVLPDTFRRRAAEEDPPAPSGSPKPLG